MKRTIAGVALACAIAGTSVELVSHTAGAATSSTTVTVRHCQTLRTLPAYGWRDAQASGSEPSGAARYRELLADDVAGAQLQHACRVQVVQQVQRHGASAATLGVLGELGYRH